MVVRVQKVGNVFSFELPPDVVSELKLEDGSSVDIRRSESETAPAIRYASVEEAMEAHRRLEPRHAEAYRELAK
jgi:antitoxin component of MazEF toxin-antitoxin module